MKADYEDLTYKIKFHRILKIAILTIVISLAVATPLLWYWDQSIQMRSGLRAAKNVVRNMELLSIQFEGLNEPLVDSARTSGMTEDAEKTIRSYSGAEGDIHLISWDSVDNIVLSMDYHEGNFLISYTYDEEAESGAWTIYRKIREY